MITVGLGILGYGTVGQGIVRLLRQNGPDIAAKTGITFEVRAVGVRDISKHREEPCGVLTEDLDSIVESAEVNLIAEVMGGLEPATTLIKRAFSNGKSVATANKAMIASTGPKLFHAAREAGQGIRFEATVCAGIPVVASLCCQLQGNTFSKLVGILNGSTNYILTQMSERGLVLEDAMAEARSRGFLEADPSSDVDGEDAAFKLSILCSAATGSWADPEAITRTGIRTIDAREIASAAAIGGVYKLIAMAQYADGKLNAAVRPAIVMPSHPFYEVRNEQNAVWLSMEPVGSLMFNGSGAGAGPTASGVIGDLIELARTHGQPPVWNEQSILARRPAFEGQFALTLEGSDLIALEEASRVLQPISVVRNGSTSKDTVLVTEAVSTALLESNLGRISSIRRIDPVLT